MLALAQYLAQTQFVKALLVDESESVAGENVAKRDAEKNAIANNSLVTEQSALARIELTPLSQGLSRQTAILSLHSQEQARQGFVVKDFSESDLQLRVEHEVQFLLDGSNLSAKVCYVDRRIIISQFLQGPLLSNPRFTESERLNYSVNALVQLHQLPTSGLNQVKKLKPKALIDSFLRQMELKRASLPAAHHQFIQQQVIACLDWCLDHILPLIKHVDDSQLTLCHGDLNFNNLIVDQQSNGRLIDFESACLAEVEFDLAMLVAVNLLTDIDLNHLVSQYRESRRNILLKNQGIKCQYQESDDVVCAKKVTRYLFFCYLINGLWFLLADNQLDAQSQLAYAKQQFTQLRKLIVSAENS
ncbi:phosphotransferase [Endozoicomonas sp. G2_1]|uniref:phosphotransferase n=1 Tax=Endozoicomonas sp. G2_1 TaxID=2821091 RepID=UPI001AD9912E|nr:phosphotransferase [Endozoicomonas sp. G2_1]MBO9490637.1 phosphotransferase [Endozoicomonas sp. G2_1]